MTIGLNNISHLQYISRRGFRFVHLTSFTDFFGWHPSCKESVKCPTRGIRLKPQKVVFFRTSMKSRGSRGIHKFGDLRVFKSILINQDIVLPCINFGCPAKDLPTYTCRHNTPSSYFSIRSLGFLVTFPKNLETKEIPLNIELFDPGKKMGVN